MYASQRWHSALCILLSPPLLCPPLCPHWSLLQCLQDDNIVTFGEFQVGYIQSCWGSKFHNLLCCNCQHQIYGILEKTLGVGGNRRVRRRLQFSFRAAASTTKVCITLDLLSCSLILISKPPLLLFCFFCLAPPLLPFPLLSSPLLTFPLYSVCMAATSTPQSSPPSIVDAIGCCR